MLLAVAVPEIARTEIVPTLTLNQTSVQGGSSASGEVTLSEPAPSGGLVIQLSSSEPSVAAVPASANVSVGVTTVSFVVSTVPVAQSAAVTIRVTAGGVNRTAQLTVLAPALSDFRLEPAAASGSTPVTFKVDLSGPVPAGGCVILLSSSNTEAAAVPASVTVFAQHTPTPAQLAGGEKSPAFFASAVAQSTAVTITASAGGATRTAPLTVPPPILSRLTVPFTSVTGGQGATGKVELNGAAPTGGLVVQLASNRDVVSVPAIVTVAAQERSASFAIATVPVRQSTVATVTATAGATRTGELHVLAPALTSFTVTSPITGGQSSLGQVTLSGAPDKGGLTVQLSSPAAANVATVPAAVIVPAGATTKTFLIPTSSVPNPVTFTITATLGFVAKADELTIAPPVPSEVTLTPATVRGLIGSGSIGHVTLNGPAPPGGITVQLASSKPAAAGVPASVTFSAGQSTVSFPIAVLPVRASTPVSITATRGGVSAAAALTVTP